MLNWGFTQNTLGSLYSDLQSYLHFSYLHKHKVYLLENYPFYFPPYLPRAMFSGVLIPMIKFGLICKFFRFYSCSLFFGQPSITYPCISQSFLDILSSNSFSTVKLSIDSLVSYFSLILRPVTVPLLISYDNKTAVETQIRLYLAAIFLPKVVLPLKGAPTTIILVFFLGWSCPKLRPRHFMISLLTCSSL